MLDNGKVEGIDTKSEAGALEKRVNFRTGFLEMRMKLVAPDNP